MSNDSIFSSTYLGPISSSFGFRDSVGSGFDLNDFFYFSSSGAGTYTITLSGLSANLDLGVYNSSGWLVDYSILSGTSSESVSVGSGRAFEAFYFQVAPNQTASSSYILNIEFTAAPQYVYDYGQLFGWHLDSVFEGYFLGWGVGWSVGWNVGWNVSWHYGWGYTWYVNDAGDWEAGYNLGWVYGWNSSWNIGWFYGWNYGWQADYSQTWDYGWYNGWGWIFIG